MTTPPGWRSLLELACRAPSVHNTQPWRWRVLDDTCVELLADRSRQLSVADPEGRNLALSCGAALHHLVVSAQAQGLDAWVDPLPDAPDADLLARVRVRPRPGHHEDPRLVEALRQRRTDRRRFTSWPVPDAQLDALAATVTGTGAHAVPVLDVTARFRCELLVGRALSVQASDPRLALEQSTWVAHGLDDGIPRTNAVPPRALRRVERPNRFASESPPPGQRALESSDGLIALCTPYDDQRSWLQAGQALSILWLAATRAGLSVVPLSQVIEVGETRQALHEDVFAGTTRPQLLLRVGWQEIARASLPPTPRRPLDEVLVS